MMVTRGRGRTPGLLNEMIFSPLGGRTADVFASVRKAKINVDLSIFEDWQVDDREAAVEWVVGAMADGEEERTMLMQLQETGWSAEQSRAICNLAKNNRS